MTKKLLLCTACFILFSGIKALHAQVNIGNTNPPDPSAALQISSNTKGILLPTVSLTDTKTFTLDGGSNSTAGFTVYNVNDNITSSDGSYPALGSGVYAWDGMGWVSAANRTVFYGYTPHTQLTSANGVAVTSALTNATLSPFLSITNNGTPNSKFVSYNSSDESFTFKIAGLYRINYKINITPSDNIGNTIPLSLALFQNINNTSKGTGYLSVPTLNRQPTSSMIESVSTVQQYTAGDILKVNVIVVGTPGFTLYANIEEISIEKIQ